MIEFEIIADDARQLLDVGTAAFGPRRVHAAMAKEGSRITRQHLRQLDKDRPSALGLASGRRSHFYARFADETREDYSEQHAAVLIGPADFGGDPTRNALAAHLFGTTIVPRRARSLAIPVHPDAYGVAPRTFDLQLMLLGKSKKVAVLAKRPQTTLRRTKTGKFVKTRLDRQMTTPEVMYILVKSATLKEDRSVLPTEMEYAWAGERGVMLIYEQMALRRRGGAS